MYICNSITIQYEPTHTTPSNLIVCLQVSKSDEVQGEIYLAVAKFGGKLRVLISEAKDLAAKDFGGSSDPYCQLTFNGTEVSFFLSFRF